MAKPRGRGNGGSRRRATVDEADKTERRTAGQQNLKFDEDFKLRQRQHIETLKGYDGKINHLVGQRRKAIGVMKSGGFNVDALRDIIKAERADPLVERDYHQQLAIGLESIGAPYRLTVSDTAYDSPEDQARFEARMAAKNGRAAECQWPEGSAEHEAYTEEYQKVQASMVPGADKLSERELEEATA